MSRYAIISMIARASKLLRISAQIDVGDDRTRLLPRLRLSEASPRRVQQGTHTPIHVSFGAMFPLKVFEARRATVLCHATGGVEGHHG